MTGESVARAGVGGIDCDRMRQALGWFATGVVVTTAWDPGQREYVGMTMNSFNSVSLDPPLVLFSISRKARSLRAWERVPYFAVNVLQRDQSHLSERFARSLTAKWEGVDFRPGRHGSPLLEGALASLECSTHAHVDGGDHVIFLGRVLHLEYRESGRPLVFFRGAYTGVDPVLNSRPERDLIGNWPLSLHY